MKTMESILHFKTCPTPLCVKKSQLTYIGNTVIILWSRGVGSKLNGKAEVYGKYLASFMKFRRQLGCQGVLKLGDLEAYPAWKFGI